MADKATQAQNSVETAHNAVQSAEANPTDRQVAQAQRSLRHAQAAVDQALESSSNESAVTSSVNQLAEDQAAINDSASE
ncbi:hypothetical protein [Paenibacillus silviterrae]|uniref:hypothetical protein n=1 Tax=Paenibacillus silviterrae TaxID=3242194 RepID=UPI002543F272|nr:hypothetical protein [Paenibacillus chinjuensis]